MLVLASVLLQKVELETDSKLRKYLGVGTNGLERIQDLLTNRQIDVVYTPISFALKFGFYYKLLDVSQKYEKYESVISKNKNARFSREDFDEIRINMIRDIHTANNILAESLLEKFFTDVFPYSKTNLVAPEGYEYLVEAAEVEGENMINKFQLSEPDAQAVAEIVPTEIVPTEVEIIQVVTNNNLVTNENAPQLDLIESSEPGIMLSSLKEKVIELERRVDNLQNDNDRLRRENEQLRLYSDAGFVREVNNDLLRKIQFLGQCLYDSCNVGLIYKELLRCRDHLNGIIHLKVYVSLSLSLLLTVGYRVWEV
jgi:hypothetical protein